MNFKLTENAYFSMHYVLNYVKENTDLPTERREDLLVVSRENFSHENNEALIAPRDRGNPIPRRQEV